MTFAGPGAQHLLHQFVAGLVFGLAAGFFAHRGLFSVCNVIGVSLFVLTILDHLGYVRLPWGWHGPGSHPPRGHGHITMGDFIWEILIFCINNFVVYLTFLFFYEVAVGQVAFFRR